MKFHSHDCYINRMQNVECFYFSFHHSNNNLHLNLFQRKQNKKKIQNRNSFAKFILIFHSSSKKHIKRSSKVGFDLVTFFFFILIFIFEHMKYGLMCVNCFSRKPLQRQHSNNNENRYLFNLE